MKLENIDDVLKENMSKYCSVHYLASCILDNEECLNLYKTCKNYAEFERKVLSKKCGLNVIYSMVSCMEKTVKITGIGYVIYLVTVVLKQHRM